MSSSSDNISKSSLKSIFANIIMWGGIFQLMIFFAINLYSVTGARSYIPDTGFQMGLMVTGCLEVLFGWLFIKWIDITSYKI